MKGSPPGNAWAELVTHSPARNEFLFPLGPYFDVVFSPKEGTILFASETGPVFKDLPAKKFSSATIYALLESTVIQDHIEVCLRFFRKSLELREQSLRQGTIFNQEFSIVSRDQTPKRVLFQYKYTRADDGSESCCGVGKFIDISHLSRDGFPKMTIFENNMVVKHYEASPEDMLKSSGLRVSLRDLNVLKLKSGGLRAKEIAGQLDMSILAVYSIIRNLKEKNKMEILPMIHQLRHKGLLSMAGLVTSLEAFEVNAWVSLLPVI